MKRIDKKPIRSESGALYCPEAIIPIAYDCATATLEDKREFTIEVSFAGSMVVTSKQTKQQFVLSLQYLVRLALEAGIERTDLNFEEYES